MLQAFLFQAMEQASFTPGGTVANLQRRRVLKALARFRHNCASRMGDT
jgi:hypothetical protein